MDPSINTGRGGNNNGPGNVLNIQRRLTRRQTARNRRRTQGQGSANFTQNQNPIRSREIFFMHYLFVSLSIKYATYFKKRSRRMIEFFALLKALLMLTLLIYLHFTFVRDNSTCLSHIDNMWPRSGVLKVQVEHNTSFPPYQFYFVKQQNQQIKKHSSSWSLYQSTPYEIMFKYSVPVELNASSSRTNFDPILVSTFDRQNKLPKLENVTLNKALFEMKELFQPFKFVNQCPVINVTEFKEALKKQFFKQFQDISPTIEIVHNIHDSVPSWVYDDPAISDAASEKKAQSAGYGFATSPPLVRNFYAIEYSNEFGFLRLSAATRHRLGIPVLVVTLDPLKNDCFGSKIKKFFLDTFLGYDDILMTSIKQLVEKDSHQGGYLRNLVTGDHFRFITLWVNFSSYILAFFVMLVFTLVVTMLLRYSYHQIFMFMVELLNILDTDAALVFPAAPMLTIILALVGTEEIMTEFFHDSTLAFYVILCIWTADQFDAICMHTKVSQRYWVRFFFLYHFAFYTYHYRFNGQFGELALYTSWLFIQHSMFYFYHHYELPAMQRTLQRRRQRHAQHNTDNNNNSGSDDAAAQGDHADVPPAPPTEPDAPVNIASESADTPAPSGSSSSDTDPQINNNEHEIRDCSIQLQELFEHVEEKSPTLAISEEMLYSSTTVVNSYGVKRYCRLLKILFCSLLAIGLLVPLTVCVLNVGKFSSPKYAMDTNIPISI